MMDRFKSLRSAITPDSPGGPLPRWADVMQDLILAAYGKRDQESEQILIEVLQFEGELRMEFDDVSEIPSAMAPEDIVRSYAAQTLGEWEGIRCVPLLRRVVETTTTSASLASIIEAVIEKISRDS